MTELATDILSFANRVAPGGTAGVAKMFGKNIGGVSSLVVQSSDNVQHQLAPVAASPGGVAYSALTNALTLGGGNTLADVATPQSIFPSTRDTITLTAGYYRVRGYINTTRTGAVSCTTTFSLAGTATYSAVGLRTQGRNSVSLTANAAIGLVTSAAGGVVIGASTVAPRAFWLDGSVVVSVGGTCSPTLTFSVAPGSTTSILAPSFIEFVPVGPDTFTQQGGWA